MSRCTIPNGENSSTFNVFTMNKGGLQERILNLLLGDAVTDAEDSCQAQAACSQNGRKEKFCVCCKDGSERDGFD